MLHFIAPLTEITIGTLDIFLATRPQHNLFGPFFKNGYEGAVKNWWLDVLKINKTRVDLLDIGCGNGAF